MMGGLSSNTQAILLLTAPLIIGRGDRSTELLSLYEYKDLARYLREKEREPADLLTPDGAHLLDACPTSLRGDRLRRLLDRGFLLSQAVEHWSSRAIWIVSRADAQYPKRLKARLKDDAPPILYGCGDSNLLNAGGLAVVGSRNATDALIGWTEEIGRLTAGAGRTLISGAARGIDQAAMRGALESNGDVVGVVADSLARMVTNREQRNFLNAGNLVLISPYDPAAGFNVGHAMQRNKLIYALADAALVVSADFEKGGTWAGATEQLERFRQVRVYVRVGEKADKGLDALGRRGALRWPDPKTPDELRHALTVDASPLSVLKPQLELPVDTKSPRDDEPQKYALDEDITAPLTADDRLTTPAEALFATVRALLERIDTPKTDQEVATELNVSKVQARQWLDRLVEEGQLDKLSRPTRYCSAASSGRLL
jgi:predicted Rossmann fold nucleotide-binding protein DprA/Smf involved in DNA uptake